MVLLPILRSVGRVPAASFRLLGSVRHGSITTWNQDWKAGPFPTTPEMYAAAAKKYGLIVEDYKPIPTGEFGDYPDLPKSGGYARDPYYNWDYQYDRRNFGEPMHIDADLYTEDRLEPQQRVTGAFPKGYTLERFILFFLSTVLVYWLVAICTWNVSHVYPILPKQYPSDVTVKGVKHYEFPEPCDG